MNKLLINSLIAFITLSSLSAQNRNGVTRFYFKPALYAGISVGPNAFVADGFSTYKFKGNIGFSENIFIGYNATETIGLRLVLGLNNINWPGKPETQIYPINFRSQSLGIEASYNLSNAIGIYDLGRLVDVSIYGGGGLMTRQKNKFPTDYFGFMFKAGGQLDFRITRRLDVNLNGGIIVLNDNFDGYIFGAPIDILAEIKAGITYHLR